MGIQIKGFAPFATDHATFQYTSALIEMRKQARANKNYAEGDRIRNELAKLGVTLEDRADGTIWRAN